MLRLSAVVAVSLVTFLPCALHAQQNRGSIPIALGDRSFYLGQKVMHPESLSGVWETSSGDGSAIGIQLELDTTIPGDGDKQNWAPQSWQHLQVGVFERKKAKIQLGEQSGVSDSHRGGSVPFDQGRLQLHFVSTWTDTPSVDLDLVQQAGGCWDGCLHRGEFDSQVTLCRPGTSLSGKASPPRVGTWAENSNFGQSCIHMAVQAPGEFTGWSDEIQLPGTVRSCIDGVSKPIAVFQSFGELLKVILKRTAQSHSNSTPRTTCVAPTHLSESSPRAES